MDEVIEQTLIGEALRKARESQKLSIEDVASRLHLSVRQINALEQDDFAVFGSAMLVRGFIKTYARVLSLDPEPLLDAHRKLNPQDKLQAIAYQSDKVVSVKAPSVSKFKALIFVVLAAISLVIVLTYQYVAHQDSAIPLQKAVHNEVEQNASGEPLPEVALPVAERDASVGVSATEIQLPKSSESKVLETPKFGDKPASQHAVTDPVKPESIKVAPEKSDGTQLGTVRVKVVLTAPSWISVQDKTGKTVFSKLAQVGADEYVEGVPPLKFHIGNVSGTQLIFNGQSVDLSANAYNNMARITLGDHQ